MEVFLGIIINLKDDQEGQKHPKLTFLEIGHVQKGLSLYGQ